MGTMLPADGLSYALWWVHSGASWGQQCLVDAHDIFPQGPTLPLQSTLLPKSWRGHPVHNPKPPSVIGDCAGSQFHRSELVADMGVAQPGVSPSEHLTLNIAVIRSV